ncbi:aconitase X [Pollutimonas bauzanensis]|uniref:Predicted aconitase subunit 1 n=1 Tax=Pollutimonas bauzanensis TaxID=658167 RepID=A0A1M5ZJB9_9BURK|nr:aconitase X [Pollutimonas bauzanensis]SHI24330.1 predicted aconitase subunit 1 [Pollutimonas bauzanensis]
MHLSNEEQAMLNGDHGEAIKKAIQFQIEVGSFFGAEKFVPITNAHVMGDIEVMGDGGLGLLKAMTDEHVKCAVPASSNARCMHFSSNPDFQPDASEEKKERQLIAHLQDMRINTTDTCINYQTVYQPKIGEHVAWGDTGTVIYANSVFGARTNFEAGNASFAAAITGRTPAYGFHLDEVRRGTLAVKVEAELKDLADWGALGKIVGHPNQDYFAVPVFEGITTTPLSDALKHLGASLASYGSMAMFHMVGVTPEAPTAEQAFGGNVPTSSTTVTDADIQAVYDAYRYAPGAKNIVVFSGPQQSLFEMQHLAQLFDGRKVAPGMSCVVTTNHAVYSDAKRLGYIDTLESAGVTLLQGVCFYILQRLTQIREENQWTNLVSNSAKIVNTITAHRFNTVLRRTGECVDIACTGELK